MQTARHRRPEVTEGSDLAGLQRVGLSLPDTGAAGVPGRPCVLVPTEDVALTAQVLPAVSRSQRAAAARYALEDGIAEALEDVHVALGPETARNRYISGVVRHQRMAEWARALSGTRFSRHRLLPDVLALPRPADGRWFVAYTVKRVTCRTPDGCGFAGGAGFFEKAWASAGKPKLVSQCPGWPDGPAVALPEARDVLAGMDAGMSRFDLCSGPYTPASGELRRLTFQVAGIAAIAMAVKFSVLAFDAVQLAELHRAKIAEAVSFLKANAPELENDLDPARSLTSLIPTGDRRHSGRFLHAVDAMSAALDPEGEGIALDKIEFSARDASLTLSITAEDLAALRRLEQRFVGAGLAPESGAATARDGAAETIIQLSLPDDAS